LFFFFLLLFRSFPSSLFVSPGPDMHTLPILPDGHRTRRLLPERFVMRQRPVRNQRVDRFPNFHGVDEHFRVVTGSHAAAVTQRRIAIHADRFRVRFLENGVLIRRDGPAFGRRYGTEDERDYQSFHGGASWQFYTAGDTLGFSTFDALLRYKKQRGRILLRDPAPLDPIF